MIFFLLKTNTGSREMEDAVAAVADFVIFLYRESTFSLDLWPIGPSIFDGARRKVALRGEDYTWAPIWWSFDNSKR